MGCNCKKKGNSNNRGKSMPVKNFRKTYSKPEKRCYFIIRK